MRVFFARLFHLMALINAVGLAYLLISGAFFEDGYLSRMEFDTTFQILRKILATSFSLPALVIIAGLQVSSLWVKGDSLLTDISNNLGSRFIKYLVHSLIEFLILLLLYATLLISLSGAFAAVPFSAIDGVIVHVPGLRNVFRIFLMYTGIARPDTVGVYLINAAVCIGVSLPVSFLTFLLYKSYLRKNI